MGALRTTVRWDKMKFRDGKTWEEKLDQWWNVEERKATWIATQLGITKGAVLGKVNRMGWSGRRPGARPGNASGTTYQYEKDGADDVLPYTRSAPSAIKDIREVDSDPPRDQRPTLENLGPRHCRWPLPGNTDRQHFCGRTTDLGQSYCEEHYPRAYKGHRP